MNSSLAIFTTDDSCASKTDFRESWHAYWSWIRSHEEMCKELYIRYLKERLLYEKHFLRYDAPLLVLPKRAQKALEDIVINAGNLEFIRRVQLKASEPNVDNLRCNLARLTIRFFGISQSVQKKPSYELTEHFYDTFQNLYIEHCFAAYYYAYLGTQEVGGWPFSWEESLSELNDIFIRSIFFAPPLEYCYEPTQLV